MTPVDRWILTSDGGGNSTFHTLEAAENFVRILDEQGVNHSAITKITLPDDPDSMKGIGGN